MSFLSPFTFLSFPSIVSLVPKMPKGQMENAQTSRIGAWRFDTAEASPNRTTERRLQEGGGGAWDKGDVRVYVSRENKCSHDELRGKAQTQTVGATKLQYFNHPNIQHKNLQPYKRGGIRRSDERTVDRQCRSELPPTWNHIRRPREE